MAQSDQEILKFWESHGKESREVILLDDILSLVTADDECANTSYEGTAFLDRHALWASPSPPKMQSELLSTSAMVNMPGGDDVPATSAMSTTSTVMKEVDPSNYPYAGAMLICVQEGEPGNKAKETYDFLCSAFITDDSTLMTTPHAFDFSDENSTAIFVPAMINGIKPIENARYGYFAVQTGTKKIHPDHKPFEDDAKKQIFQILKDPNLIKKSKMEVLKSYVSHIYHLNPSVDMCTVKVGEGTSFATFKDAGLKPIPVKSTNPTFDGCYPCEIIGYCRTVTHDGHSMAITMHKVEGNGHVDGGNSRLFMNKVSQHGMSGGPWIMDSNAIGLQSAVLNNRSSYSPLFNKENLSLVGVDSS